MGPLWTLAQFCHLHDLLLSSWHNRPIPNRWARCRVLGTRTRCVWSLRDRRQRCDAAQVQQLHGMGRSASSHDDPGILHQLLCRELDGHVSSGLLAFWPNIPPSYGVGRCHSLHHSDLGW